MQSTPMIGTVSGVPKPSAPSAPGYSVNLVMECARGLAALWVFLFHIADMVERSFPHLYPLAKEGYRGVPVFFAVSGYCIYAAAQKARTRDSGARLFLQRRLMRIFPTFWISILVVMGLPYLLELISYAKSGRMHWPDPLWLRYSMSDWLGIVSLTKVMVDGAAGGEPGYTYLNSVYWTLAIEIQFYLVMYAAVVWRHRWRVILAAVSAAALAVLALGWIVWPGFFLEYWPAFLCGVLLRAAHARGITPSAIFGRHELAGAGVSLFLVASATWLCWHFFGMPFTASAAIAALGLWSLGGIEHALPRARFLTPFLRRVGALLLLPLVMLGQCSYSLYLLHGKLYQLPSMFVRQVVAESHPLHLLAVVAATIMMCYVFYLIVERRFQLAREAPPEQPGLTVQAVVAPTSPV